MVMLGVMEKYRFNAKENSMETRAINNRKVIEVVNC